MAFRVRGLQKGELDGLLLCFQDAFEVDDASISVVRNSLINDPFFHPERVRVGLLNGRIVSHVVILHRSSYVGAQTITVAGLTAVATHPAYQRQGFGARVVQDALRYIKNQGYHLTLLTTRLPGFFSRFGFREVPKIAGYECPAAALAQLELPSDYQLHSLDYQANWRAINHIYQQYSPGITGMQVRDSRFWESWPRRGTFPHGFSSRLGAIGLLALHNEEMVAYLAAHASPDHDHLAVTDLAHLRGYEEAALTLLREAALRYLEIASGRAVLHLGGNTPVIQRLTALRLPLEVEVGPGLMLMFPTRDWFRNIGLSNTDETIERLFRSEPPIVWHRDGY